MTSVISQRHADGQIVLDSPVTLPAVLDLLIVGGGPFGTACAFRAKELKLAALVIEMDDLLKRIRDYEKEKPILADYGGGDTMQFPAGGELVSALQFKKLQKDEMVDRWKGLYRQFSVPAQIGVEMLDVDLQPDGLWKVEARNHFKGQPQSFFARNVVLGLGRGVPRRLDIQGNVQDLANRLIRADQYVGAPACVIGGGTSAAEAVIAISKAKAESGTDETPVYWSYRGLFMPKVSQALAPDLFDVLMSNGNLRFALGSDPVGVATREGLDYLAIRTSVTEQPGFPREVVQLEFQKAFCVACIGADRPDPLLRSVGVEFVPKESGDGDRLVVSPILGTRRPGLFVGGDLLSQDYAEAADFEDDPSTFTIRARRGNIKAALRDGVLLAEVVKQRLEGKEDISVILEPAAAPAPMVTVLAPVAGSAAPRRPVPAAAAPKQPSSPGRLISLLADGMPADEYPLVSNGVTTIGRQSAMVAFPNDSMLSEQHASIQHGPSGLELQDLGSQNGVFIKVAEGRALPLSPGTIIKVGRQWLVARQAAGATEIVHSDASGKEVSRHRLVEGQTLVLGRTAPSVALEREDGTLSRRHLSFSLETGRVLLRDLGSRNGTYVKIDRPWALQAGDLIWIGHQLLRVELDTGQPTAPSVVAGKASPAASPRPASPPQAAPAVPAASGGPSVTFGPGKTFPFPKRGTLLDLAIDKKVRIKYDCKVGDCGKCRVEVKSGAEYLGTRTVQEEKALRMIGHEEPESRLACLVKDVTGPVVVQVPK